VAEPLSFCFVTTFYPPYASGGDAMYLYSLSNELAARGHRVTVVHCVDSYRVQTSAPPRGAFPHHDHVRVVPLRSPLRTLSPLATYLSGQPALKRRALDSVFASERFDVVHFHLVTLLGPGVLSYGSDAVRLYTMHDHWLVCPMYDLWKLNRELCEQPSCLRCTLSFGRPPQLWRYSGLLERQLAEVDLFLAPSESAIDQHRRRGFSHPIRRLPHFLPLEEAPAEPRGPEQEPYFLFVGRLVTLKGVHTLVETFRSYDRAQLLVAGDGVLERELRARAQALPHVRFLGRVHPDELRRLYRDAVAVLIPSLAYETFGMIALEAFRQRTPVIARDLGAVGELVRESGGGIAYTTEAELVEAMELLRTSPEARDELAERGHRTYREQLTPEPHLQRYFELIEEARELRGASRKAAA
jgi:glycosyltransferase involved in cell wall biosynthesis